MLYERPDSIYYMASNVELNYARTRLPGTKPIYVYEWLRYWSLTYFAPEVAPYIAEAMAIVPFFSGAKGIVLWGYEPQLTSGIPYKGLPRPTWSILPASRLFPIVSAADSWRSTPRRASCGTPRSRSCARSGRRQGAAWSWR